jgi:hypothetical protein
MYGLSIVFADNGELIELLGNGVKGDVLCIIDLESSRLFDYFGPAFCANAETLAVAGLLPNRNYIYKPNKESRCSEITTLIASEQTLSAARLVANGFLNKGFFER